MANIRKLKLFLLFRLPLHTHSNQSVTLITVTRAAAAFYTTHSSSENSFNTFSIRTSVVVVCVLYCSRSSNSIPSLFGSCWLLAATTCIFGESSFRLTFACLHPRQKLSLSFSLSLVLRSSVFFELICNVFFFSCVFISYLYFTMLSYFLFIHFCRLLYGYPRINVSRCVCMHFRVEWVKTHRCYQKKSPKYLLFCNVAVLFSTSYI